MKASKEQITVLQKIKCREIVTEILDFGVNQDQIKMLIRLLALELEDRDLMFNEAARVIVSNQQGSASFLQRKLKLGYNRAGRLIDQMEDAGIVGPFEGSKPRQVLISDLNSLETLLSENQK